MVIVLPGTPPQKNARHKLFANHGKVGRRNSPEFKDLVSRLEFARLQQHLETIKHGVWHVEVTAYWPRTRHLGDVDVPLGDWDAPVSCISDALERAGIVDNDARIVSGAANKAHDARNPRTIVRLTRV